MSESDSTINRYVAKIHEHERAAAKIKKLVNDMLEIDGKPPMFADIAAASAPTASFRADQFFNQPFASCVRAVLEARAAVNQGAASVDDLYDALLAGGFNFEQKDQSIAKRNLAISMGKNTVTFVKLPNGLWGLKEWYPGGGRAKARNTMITPETGSIHIGEKTVQVTEKDGMSGDDDSEGDALLS